MSDQQFIIVPKISSYPGAQSRARVIQRWLVERGIIAPQLSACGSAPGRLAYGIGPRAAEVLEPAGAALLPYELARNGVEIVTDRCIYTPERGFEGRARCPECRKQIGEALLEHLEEWMPAETENFTCPECGHEDDINGFPFSQPCGFSDLGFIFNNWPGRYFRRSFIEEFTERLGYPLALVEVAY